MKFYQQHYLLRSHFIKTQHAEISGTSFYKCFPWSSLDFNVYMLHIPYSLPHTFFLKNKHSSFLSSLNHLGTFVRTIALNSFSNYTASMKWITLLWLPNNDFISHFMIKISSQYRVPKRDKGSVKWCGTLYTPVFKQSNISRALLGSDRSTVCKCWGGNLERQISCCILTGHDSDMYKLKQEKNMDEEATLKTKTCKWHCVPV